MRIIKNFTINDFEKALQIKPILDKEEFKKRIQMQNEEKAEFLYVEDEGNPVCFILFKWEGKPTHPEYPDLEDLYTKGEERGKGYASLLVKECEKRAKEKGFKKIGMAVNPEENCPAHRLYKRLGYVHDGKDKYVDGVYNGVEDWCIDMEKEL